MQQKWTLPILTCLCLPITHQVVQSTLHFYSNQIKSSNITNIWGCSFLENPLFSMPCCDRKLPFLASGPDLVDFDLKSDIWGGPVFWVFSSRNSRTVPLLKCIFLFLSGRGRVVWVSSLLQSWFLTCNIYLPLPTQLFCLQSTTPFSCPGSLIFDIFISENRGEKSNKCNQCDIASSHLLLRYICRCSTETMQRAPVLSPKYNPLFLVLDQQSRLRSDFFFFSHFCSDKISGMVW